MLNHFYPWHFVAVLLSIGLLCLWSAWLAWRADRDAEAREIRDALSDAVPDEESLPLPPAQRAAGERLDRESEIALAEREILWAVEMLTRCEPEVERVWVTAIKHAEKRLERLRRG